MNTSSISERLVTATLALVISALLIGGMSYFVSGLGGVSSYSFRSPIPGSMARYNDDYGAMRVTVDARRTTFEFLSLDDGASGAYGGRLIDTLATRPP